MIEELLQLLVDKVDGDLLKAVVLKDLKASNVEHSTEVGLFLRRNSEKTASIDFILDSDLNTEGCLLTIVGSTRVSLHFSISHLKTLSKMALNLVHI